MVEIRPESSGERKKNNVLEKYGRDSFEAHKTALFDATRKMMEAEIATIPEGAYKGEGYVYFDGHHLGTKFTIRVTVTVKDKHITFDYSDTDAQTDGFVNGTYTSSASAAILTFLQMVNPLTTIILFYLNGKVIIRINVKPLLPL